MNSYIGKEVMKEITDPTSHFEYYGWTILPQNIVPMEPESVDYITKASLKLDDPKYIEEVYSTFPLEQRRKILNNYIEFMMTEYVKLAVRLNLNPAAEVTLKDASTDMRYTFGVTQQETSML